MPYQQVAFSDLKTLALNRLGNSTFWSATEVGVYINEAIRIWNTMTGYWAGAAAVTVTAAPTALRFHTNTLVGQTVTDQNILNEIQHHVMETANNGASFDSDIWTIAEVVDWLNDRNRRFLAETRLIQNLGNITTVINQARYELNDLSATLIDIIRIAWVKTSDNSSYEVSAFDPLRMDLLRSNWPSQQDTPVIYSRIVQPTTSIDLIPAPNVAGKLDIIYTDTGAALSNTAVVTTVPNDFTPYVKWGVLADMFKKEGQSFDPLRWAYCRRRFEEGVLIAQQPFHLVNRMEFNGVPMEESSLFMLDQLIPKWQDDRGTPSKWILAGLTKFIIHPEHTAGGLVVDIEGYKNAPILSAAGDFIDIGRWQLEYLLDYIQHIATFKVGGAVFEATLPLYENFLKGAMIQNSRLSLLAPARRSMAVKADFGGYPTLIAAFKGGRKANETDTIQ